MILDITMLLQTLRLQWRRGIYVTRVTHCMTLHTSVIKLAPYEQRHHPVLNIGQSIVILATGGSWVKYVFGIISLIKWKASYFVSGEKYAEILVLQKQVIINTNVSREFATIAIRTKHQAIFAMLFYWNLASWQTGLFMFSLIRSAHNTLKNIMGPLSILRTSYVLSRWVHSVKRWMTWMLI